MRRREVKQKKEATPATTATGIMLDKEFREDIAKRIRLLRKLKSVIDDMEKAGMFFPWYQK